MLALALALAGCGRAPAPEATSRPQGSGYAASRPHRSSQPVAVKAKSARADAIRAAAKSANVVIVVLDAARADHVGCYGYPRETTPNIDRLAKESAVLEGYFTTYPMTKPSTVSLFTGLYPDTHLVTRNSELIRPDDFTLAKGLSEAGFQTVFLSSSPVASTRLGIGGDFELALERPLRGGGRAAAARGRHGGMGGAGHGWTPEAAAGDLERWLGEGRRSRFFAYIHFMPPHAPYDAPQSMKNLFAGKPPTAWQGDFPFRGAGSKPSHPRALEEWVNQYDASLRWADWGVGEIERVLRERDLLDDTLFIVTSDHGEAFGEHGYTYHRYGVYDELVRAPLLMRLPGEKRLGVRVSALAQTVDLLPTVFDLFGLPYPREVQGTSLLPVLTGEANSVRDYVYATCSAPRPSYLVRDTRWALILWEGGTLRALYDLQKDPTQRENVIQQEPEQAARMVDAFRQFAETQRRRPLEFVDPNWKPERLAGAPRVKLSEEQERELKALGYMD